MSIGTRVIQIRNLKGLNQRQLSERCGIANSYLSRIENRHLEPRPKTLRKIAEALSVPVSDFFQEGPAARGRQRCAITVSGNCAMEILRSRRGGPPGAGTESYTPHQLQLLRMADYLIQSGNTRLLDTLEMLLQALLSAESGRRAAKAWVPLRPKPNEYPTP